MTTLISFLGRNRRDPATGYQRATYAFDDGGRVQTAFFGSALMDRLRPERTLLLGTAGSMWDALDFDTATPEWIELMEATEHSHVDQALLDRVSTRARKGMQGAELVLIPYCRDEAEQMVLLANLASRVAERETVVLDITHGFRHLPLLALVAARYLGHVRKAVVRDIYYGALEMTADGISPVLKVDGLLRLLDWIEAFAAHDASGNYAAFSPLLARDGIAPNWAEQLERAAHFERVTNSAKAKEIVAPLLGEIDRLDRGPARLFKSQLAQRLAWARKPSRDARERALFEAYLARGDFLRAVIYLQESTISAACMRDRLDGNDHSQREQARDSLRPSADFSALSDLRNMLAHGTLSGDTKRAKAAADAAATASALAGRLRKLADALDAPAR